MTLNRAKRPALQGKAGRLTYYPKSIVLVLIVIVLDVFTGGQREPRATARTEPRPTTSVGSWHTLKVL
jgi:hypothetical protein